jgi:hypothetical protein
MSMSSDSIFLPSNPRIAETSVANLQPPAVLQELGQRVSISSISDARFVARTHSLGADVSIIAAGKNKNTKFYMLVRSDFGRAEYVYLGNDKEQARSVAQSLLQSGRVSKSEAQQGSLVAWSSFGSAAARDQMVDEMRARVEAILADARASQSELIDQWIRVVSGDTRDDRLWDEFRKSREYEVLVKQMSESITLRVQRYADGLISRSEALAGLPEVLANRVAGLIDSTMIIPIAQAKAGASRDISAENKIFDLIAARVGGVLVVDPSSLKTESATA